MYTAREINGGMGWGGTGLSQSFSRFPDKRLLANGERGEAGGGVGSTGFQIELSFKPRRKILPSSDAVVPYTPRTRSAYLIRFYSIRAAHAIAAWKRF